MTSAIHHGPPGSFKTHAVVQRVIVPALADGRLVITNIRGCNDLARFRAAGFTVHPDTRIFYVDPEQDKQSSRDTIARFFSWAPVGALICIDEAQNIYPARLRSLDEFNVPPSDGRPSSIYEAMNEHRHYNWDIYFTTTNIAKLHKEIRLASEFAFRHRDMSILAPWKKGKYREHPHDPESSGKSPTHYTGTPKEYTYSPAVFGCYASTLTGEAHTSSETLSVTRDPRLRWLGVSFVFILIVGFYVFGHLFETFSSRIEAGSPASEEALSEAPVSGTPTVVLPSPEPSEPPRKDPVETYITYTGDDYIVSIVPPGDDSPGQLDDPDHVPLSEDYRVAGRLTRADGSGRVLLRHNSGRSLYIDSALCELMPGSDVDYQCDYQGFLITPFTGDPSGRFYFPPPLTNR